MKDRKLQALRGLACLMLVLYHVVGSDPERGLRVTDGGLRLAVDGLAAVRMPLFALLAGVLYGWRPQASWPALADKARRLLIPVVTVGTLFALVQSAVPGTNKQVTDWHLLHVLPVAHFWFLQSLFLVFTVVMGLERLGLLQRPRAFLPVAALSVAVYLDHPGLVYFGMAGMVYLMPYFLAGMALVRYGWGQALDRSFVPVILGALGATVLAIWAPPAPFQDRYTLGMITAGLLFATAFWLLPLRGRWIERIGDDSYTIFLYHAFFTAATRIALERFGVHAVALQVAAGLLIGVLGPMAVHRLLVRWSWSRAALLGMPDRRRAPIRESAPSPR